MVKGLKMTVQIENEEEYCVTNISYVGDPDVVSAKRNETLSLLKKENPKLRVPGFRPGKAPDAAIIKTYKDFLDEGTKRSMLLFACDEIVFETSIKPIGLPKVDKLFLSGDKFECNLTFHKQPEFALNDSYKHLELPPPQQPKSLETLIQEALVELAKAHGEQTEFCDGDVSQVGDTVSINVKRGEDPDETMVFTVGDNRIGPNFDVNIIGMAPDEVKTFEYDGKNFQVTLLAGMKVRPHEVNEEFAVKCGAETLEDLNNKLKAVISLRIEKRKESEIIRGIANKLIEDNAFEVPAFLYEKEVAVAAAKRGLEFEMLDEAGKEQLRNVAKDNVKFSLVLDAIRAVEPDAVLSDMEADQIVRQQASMNGQVKDVEKALAGGYFYMLLAEVKDRHVLNWLINQVKFVEEK